MVDTKIINNKKAVIQWIFVVIAVTILFGFILFSKGVLGNWEATSQTNKVNGYNKDRCPSHLVMVSGNINIEDTGGLTLNPSIRTIKDIEVTSKELCFFCSQAPFTYTVSVEDAVSGRVIGNEFKGSGELRGNDNQGIDKSFSVNYKIPDENCDGWYDDHTINLKVKLKGDDIGDRAEYIKEVRFRNGRVAI